MSGRFRPQWLALLPLLGLLLGLLGIGWQALTVREFKQQLRRCERSAVSCQAPQRTWLKQQAKTLANSFQFNAEYAELLARSEVLFAGEEADLPAYRAGLKRALQWADRAIGLRPHWPYAYSARLGILLKLGDLDRSTDQTWRDAWQFGPNEKRVLHVLAESVFVYRDAGRVPPTPVQPILHRLAIRDRAMLVELGTRYGGRDLLCSADGPLHTDPICQPDLPRS